MRPTSKVPHDAEMIPELAVRNSTDETYHTGVSVMKSSLFSPFAAAAATTTVAAFHFDCAIDSDNT